jgi:predicted nucleotidyltransferase
MAVVDSEKQIKNIAAQYAELLKKHVELHSLYVYGSHASGKYTEDSDIDIAVVADGFTGDLIEDTLKLMKVRRSVDNRIEPHPFSIEQFNEDDPMAKEIMNSGIRIV